MMTYIPILLAVLLGSQGQAKVADSDAVKLLQKYVQINTVTTSDLSKSMRVFRFNQCCHQMFHVDLLMIAYCVLWLIRPALRTMIMIMYILCNLETARFKY